MSAPRRSTRLTARASNSSCSLLLVSSVIFGSNGWGCGSDGPWGMSASLQNLYRPLKYKYKERNDKVKKMGSRSSVGGCLFTFKNKTHCVEEHKIKSHRVINKIQIKFLFSEKSINRDRSIAIGKYFAAFLGFSTSSSRFTFFTPHFAGSTWSGITYVYRFSYRYLYRIPPISFISLAICGRHHHKAFRSLSFIFLVVISPCAHCGFLELLEIYVGYLQSFFIVCLLFNLNKCLFNVCVQMCFQVLLQRKFRGNADWSLLCRFWLIETFSWKGARMGWS